MKSFLHYFTDNITLPPLCIFRYILCTLYTMYDASRLVPAVQITMMFSWMGKTWKKKKKSKCTCAHFKIAALSSCPIIHFKNSNINSLLTNQTFLPSLPPNTIKPAIKATMLWVITEEKIFWKKQLFHFLNILNSKLLSDLHFYVNLVHTYAAKILHCWQQ